MATTINAGDLTNGASISSDTTGALVLQTGAAGSKVAALTISAAGVVKPLDSAWPAFSAYQSTLQSISASNTNKLSFQTEEFDTANAFDSTTNYRFTPQVAGYYQISGGFQVATSAADLRLYVYKIGSAYKNINTSVAASNWTAGSCLVFMNGSTDYVELFGYSSLLNNTNPVSSATYFQGCLVRAA